MGSLLRREIPQERFRLGPKTVKTPANAVRRWHVIAALCLLNGYRKGAELGVSKGRFTMYLCAVMGEMEMTAVDLWAAQPDNTAEGSQTYDDWDHEESYRTFKETTEALFPERVNILRMSTNAASWQVPDGSMDFVFIDADHSFAGCSDDISCWYPKVRSGGLLAGHDYNWPTVSDAVSAAGLKVAVLPDHVWTHFKP